MTPLQAVRTSKLSDNVMECIRHVIEKHDSAFLEVAIELRKENDALRKRLRKHAIDLLDDAAVQLHAAHTVRGKWPTDPLTRGVKSEWRYYGRVIAALQKLIEREDE